MVQFCQGVVKMKKINKILKKFIPVVVGCLTLVLSINANTASCFIINQPKEPETINKFKLFK